MYKYVLAKLSRIYSMFKLWIRVINYLAFLLYLSCDINIHPCSLIYVCLYNQKQYSKCRYYVYSIVTFGKFYKPIHWSL